jgi:uncharacterized membrane protein
LAQCYPALTNNNPPLIAVKLRSRKQLSSATQEKRHAGNKAGLTLLPPRRILIITVRKPLNIFMMVARHLRKRRMYRGFIISKRAICMHEEIVVLNERERSAKNLAFIMYLLYCAACITCVTALVALVVHFTKGEETRGTFVESHLRWQIRTVIFSTLFFIIGGITTFIGIGFVILFFNAIWVIYRLVAGMLRLNDNKPMYFY